MKDGRVLKTNQDRYDATIEFVEFYVDKKEKILDLGVVNDLSNKLIDSGFQVNNTKGEDLDLDVSAVETEEYDVVTSFEIFEHMLCPFNILRKIKAKKLIISVPLKLWFANAYWSNSDERDRHYHEFEPKQLDMLLDKAGWKIVNSKKWISISYKMGIRPLLRRFYPRFYVLYCERK